MRNPIPLKFTFTSGELFNYLKTIKTFSKLDQEILATLTYKKAYRELKNKDLLISFPYKQSRQKEIENRHFLTAGKAGKFIQENIEQDSPIDSLLVDPIDTKTSLVRPLQIKFFGRGSNKVMNDKKFIDFLMKYRNYDAQNVSLIIVLEGSFKINLQKISNWLKSKKFPFPEVVLINPNNKSGDMGFYQLKPSRKNPASMLFTRKEMYTELFN